MAESKSPEHKMVMKMVIILCTFSFPCIFRPQIFKNNIQSWVIEYETISFKRKFFILINIVMSFNVDEVLRNFEARAMLKKYNIIP